MPSTVSFVDTRGASARVAARLVAASGRRNCMSPRWSTQAKPGPVRVEEVVTSGKRRPKSGWVGSTTSISSSGAGAPSLPGVSTTRLVPPAPRPHAPHGLSSGTARATPHAAIIECCAEPEFRERTGLYKTEVIRHRGPWRGFDDVEYATLEWVAWFNTQRLLEPLGYVPPAEYEEQFYRAQAAQADLVALK